jgi:hypothetical protein
MSGYEQPVPGEFGRVVATSIYSREAISSAQSAFKRHCAVTVRPNGQGYVSVIVRPFGEAATLAAQAVLEFWNFALDAEAQRRLEVD